MKITSTLFVSIITLMFCFAGAYAQDGKLDTSFSHNGIAFHPQVNLNNSHPSRVMKMLVMPDSTIVLACNPILQPDVIPGIAKMGYVFCHMDKRGNFIDTIPEGQFPYQHTGYRFISAPNGLQDGGVGAADLTMLPNGQLLLTTSIQEISTAHRMQTTIKFNYPSMAIDTTYGVNGMGQLWEGMTYPDQFAEKTGIGSDGSTYTSCSMYSFFGDSLFACVVKRKPNGMRDSAWQDNGVFRFVPHYGAIIHDIHVAANGYIYSSGMMKDTDRSYRAFVMKQLPNGTIDGTYGADGLALQEYIGKDMILNSDGSTYMMGQLSNPFVQSSYVAKFKPNGKADSTFGLNGRLDLPASDTTYQITCVIKQPDGKLDIAGYTLASYDPVSGSISKSMFSGRILPNGKFDTTFGNRGIAVFNTMPETLPSVPLYPKLQRQAECVALQKDGKLLMGGYTIMSSATPMEMLVLRLNNHDNVPTPAGIQPLAANDMQLTAFPVPAGNVLHLKYMLAKEDKLTINLTDINGRMLLSKNMELQASGRYEQDMELPLLPAGIYMLAVRGIEHSEYLKVIIK